MHSWNRLHACTFTSVRIHEGCIRGGSATQRESLAMGGLEGEGDVFREAMTAARSLHNRIRNHAIVSTFLLTL